MFRLIKNSDDINPDKNKNNKDNSNIKSNLNNQTNSNNQKDDEYTYASMRKLAFTIKPEDMDIKIGNDYQVYGAVVDMGVDSNKIATMICFIDGTTSLYFSDGGGIIGAGRHESVKNAASTFLENCFSALPVTENADSIDKLPAENQHTFYLFTKAGIFTITINLHDVKKCKEYQSLFTQSHIVLNEIRKISKKD